MEAKGKTPLQGSIVSHKKKKKLEDESEEKEESEIQKCWKMSLVKKRVWDQQKIESPLPHIAVLNVFY